jgi:hypothetical protein
MNIAQCANFTFESDLKSFGLYFLYGANYCKYIFKKNEEFPLKALPTVICEYTFDLSDLKMISGTVCAASLPYYNKMKVKINSIKILMDLLKK